MASDDYGEDACPPDPYEDAPFDGDESAVTVLMTEEDFKKQGQILIQFRRALEEGDRVTAGQSLRQLPQIDGYMKDVLADMLEGNPGLDSRFHWFLQFIGRSKGAAPKTKDQKRDREELFWQTVKKHLSQTDNVTSSLEKTAQELNLGLSTVRDDYYKHKRKFARR